MSEWNGCGGRPPGTVQISPASFDGHLANAGAVSWHEFARAAASRAGLDTALLVPCSTPELGLRAPRPAYSALSSVRGGLMPPLEHALERFIDAWRQASAAGRVSTSATPL